MCVFIEKLECIRRGRVNANLPKHMVEGEAQKTEEAAKYSAEGI